VIGGWVVSAGDRLARCAALLALHQAGLDNRVVSQYYVYGNMYDIWVG